jgi:RNA polymerase sigma factor (sigma-70 family)
MFSYWVWVDRPTLLDAGALMRSTVDTSRRPRAILTARRVVRPLRPKPVSRARPLDPLGQARVEAFTPLAYRLAWYYARQRARDVPPDELIAEALYGLTYAAGMFDEARRVPFVAYATLAIRHRLAQLIRTWRKAKRAVPYPVGSNPGDDAPWEAADHRPKPDLVAGASARDQCDRVRRVLPARWYTVLRLRHAEGWTFQEIGDYFGVSRQWIRQVLEKATDRVRRHFPDWPTP